MSSSRPIYFHVGAHKTATTYMQSRLRSNRQRLRNHGVHFVDLWAKAPALKRYRKRLKRLLEAPAVNDRKLGKLAAVLRRLVDADSSDDKSRIVLSYENALGGFDLTRSAAPYPHAAAAVAHIREAFPDQDVKILFSIRSLDRFLESGYLQNVLSRQETRTFARYLGGVDIDGLSWLPAIRDMESVVGAENLLIWNYENFPANESTVWDLLLGLADADSLLVRPAKKSNQSLSAKGLKFMRRINSVATPSEAKKFRTFIKENFGPESGFERPTLLDEGTREQLVRRYARDCEELQGRLILSPGPQAAAR